MDITVEQDEDGIWCARAIVRPGVGAVGDGPTREAALVDMQASLDLLLEELKDLRSADDPPAHVTTGKPRRYILRGSFRVYGACTLIFTSPSGTSGCPKCGTLISSSGCSHKITPAPARPVMICSNRV